jgi:hypothetical protein
MVPCRSTSRVASGAASSIEVIWRAAERCRSAARALARTKRVWAQNSHSTVSTTPSMPARKGQAPGAVAGQPPRGWPPAAIRPRQFQRRQHGRLVEHLGPPQEHLAPGAQGVPPRMATSIVGSPSGRPTDASRRSESITALTVPQKWFAFPVPSGR